MLPSVPLLFGGVTGFIGGGAFFPLIGGVLPFGEALGPAFAFALALGTESKMMNNYEQASIKSIIIGWVWHFPFYINDLPDSALGSSENTNTDDNKMRNFIVFVQQYFHYWEGI